MCTVDSGNCESQKEHLKVPGHILPETGTITPPSSSPTLHHPLTPTTHTLDRVYLYSTVLFHDTMQVAPTTAVTTVRTYMFVGT